MGKKEVKMPKLSIIIPTYNEENYLPDLLKSIRTQNWQDYEIIVSDANSTDSTEQIAREFGARVVKGPKLGPGFGRNHGAEVATGELLLFLDADVRLPAPDFLKHAVEEFEKRGLGIAGFYCRAWDGHLVHRFLYRLANLFLRLTQRVDPHVPGWAILVRRSLHQAVQGFDVAPAFREDHEYLNRVRRLAKFGFLRAGPILVSVRRFVQDGTLKTLCIYLVTELARPFGRIPYARFNYRFGGRKLTSQD